MKLERTKQSRFFLLLTLLFALAAVFQLQARIREESRNKAIAVIMLQEDIAALSEADGSPLSHWYHVLAEAGLTAVIVPQEDLNQAEIVLPIEQAELEIAQLGGSGASGLYLAPLEYDIQSGQKNDLSIQIAPSNTGRIWTLIENNPQTSCVLPDGYSVKDTDGPWAKGFYLRQNEKARAVTTELSDAREVGDMLFRAVADRGVQVLWIAPLGDENGVNTNPDTYEALLNRLQTRIERCGYHFGIPQGLEPLKLSCIVLVFCGIGIFSAAVLLLCLLWPISMRAAWIVFVICVLECAAASMIQPRLQALLLAFCASIVFPALSVCSLGKQLSDVQKQQTLSLRSYLRAVIVGAAITFLGCMYIGAVLGSWQYILVLQVFRGVKLSQFAVYLFSIVMLGIMILEIRRGAGLKSLLPSFNRDLMVRIISISIILFGVGMIYLMRSGDGMLGVSSFENHFRAALENLILYRPRTKELLIAWPSISIAFCFAARKNRLFAWLFGALGGIGFASMANTFCHIRAHFLVSVARSALGLFIGLALGTILFVLFRPSKE